MGALGIKIQISPPITQPGQTGILKIIEQELHILDTNYLIDN